MSTLEQIITIELLGEYFKFRADKDSRMDAGEIAQYLVREVNQVASRFPVHSQKTNKLAIVVLAALNMAKQHMELQIEHNEFMQSIADKTLKIDRIIDSGLCH
jgi:cell division protein ZapA (FtsZ GTPase activity inhibitor)